jgi:hypothetical protein
VGGYFDPNYPISGLTVSRLARTCCIAVQHLDVIPHLNLYEYISKFLFINQSIVPRWPVVVRDYRLGHSIFHSLSLFPTSPPVLHYCRARTLELSYSLTICD